MAGDEHQPHVVRCSRTVGPGVRENAFVHIPGGPPLPNHCISFDVTHYYSPLYFRVPLRDAYTAALSHCHFFNQLISPHRPLRFSVPSRSALYLVHTITG